jgi:hypothetical protein
MLMRLPAKFVSGQMIFLAMGNGGGLVGVGRQVVELRGSIVSALRHKVLLISWSLVVAVDASAAGLTFNGFF